jgi:hypothetical protein
MHNTTLAVLEIGNITEEIEIPSGNCPNTPSTTTALQEQTSTTLITHSTQKRLGEVLATVLNISELTSSIKEATVHKKIPSLSTKLPL